MRRLLLRRTHPWAHRDGAGSGIVEEVPRQGAPAIVAAVVAGAVDLAFSLPLALTLAFATVVGVGGRSRLRHGGSYDGERGGSCYCGGRPPPEGAE
jgi:hypothetical protein